MREIETGPVVNPELGLGTLLRMPYQVMIEGSVGPALAEMGFGDVRIAHFPVIQALGMNPDGLRATDLATYARITKQSMGYLVDHLSEGGYVERVSDPEDGRAKVIRLTPRGWTLGRSIRDLVLEVERDWAERVGPDRIRELRAILRELVDSLNSGAR